MKLRTQLLSAISPAGATYPRGFLMDKAIPVRVLSLSPLKCVQLSAVSADSTPVGGIVDLTIRDVHGRRRDQHDAGAFGRTALGSGRHCFDRFLV